MEEITFDERTQFTENYKSMKENGTLKTKNAGGEELLGFMFDSDKIEKKIAEIKPDKIFVELGAHSDGTLSPVITLMKDGFAAAAFQWSEPCPPYCG